MLNEKKNRFSNSLDLNGNNQLDLNEFKQWYMPSFDLIIGDEERYILKSCNEDKEDKQTLTKPGVKKCCQTLLSSQLTNFGIDLSQNAERNYKFYDEL